MPYAINLHKTEATTSASLYKKKNTRHTQIHTNCTKLYTSFKMNISVNVG